MEGSKIIRCIIMAVLFVFGVALVIIGQKNIGPTGLAVMLVGVAILVTELFIYNHKYK